MNVLEKIVEEMENESKLAHEEMRRCARGNPLQFDEVKGYARAMEYVVDTIRSRMDEIPNCEGCSRRKWYQKGIEDGKKDNDWIPVEERLPNEEEFKEAYCRNKYAAEFVVMIEGATRPTTLYYKNGSWFDEERNYYSVVAWQPLPEPYKEGEE